MQLPKSISPRLTALLIAVVLAIIAYQSFGFRPIANGPKQPVIIATFDLERTINGSDEYRALLETVRKQAETMSAKSDDQRKSIKQMEDDLKDLEEHGAKHKELLEKIAQATSEYDAYSKYIAYRIDRDRAKALLTSYKSVRRAADELATQNHYAMVLVDDSISDVLPGSEQEVKRQISGRRMVYTGPDVDVTDAMIQGMNEAFKAAGGVAPPPPRQDAANAPAKK